MPVPKGLEKCPVCGEYKGTVKGSELSRFWEQDESVDDDMKQFMEESYEEDRDKMLTVTCLCDGIPCQRCGKNKIHRPISNSYDEKSNTIEHWAFFCGQIPCWECKRKEQTRS